MLRLIISYFLSLILILEPLLASANGGIVPDGSTKTHIDAAPNGVPVINIADPNSQGQSWNNYNEFNIDNKGAILNNSRTQGTSQLGGIILGNPNLSNNANQIINKVTSSSKSEIEGFAEVFGPKADLLFINPNGMMCNGCGFINTSRAILSTGDVENNARGELVSKIRGGEIDIEDNGVNAEGTDYFTILSRVAKINAKINAGKNLEIHTGTGNANLNTGEYNKVDVAGDKPTLALDSSAVGGMYAGSIRIIANEDGVGIKLPPDLIATLGDVNISSDGKISYNNVQAEGKIKVESTNNDLEQDGIVNAKQSVELTAHNDLKVKGQVYSGTTTKLNASNNIIEENSIISSGTDLEVKGDNLTIRDGAKLLADGTQELNIKEDISNEGLLYSLGELNIKATNLSNDGDIFGSEGIDIQIDDINNSGLITSYISTIDDIARGGLIAITTTNNFINTGLIFTGGKVTIVSHNFSNINNSNKGIISGDLQKITVDGTMSSTGYLGTFSAPIIGGGLLDADSYTGPNIELDLGNNNYTNNGRLESAGLIKIIAGSLTNNGSLLSGGNIEVNTGTGAITNNSSSSIIANGYIKLIGGDITNSGDMLATDYIDITGRAITNNALIASNNYLNIRASGSINNYQDLYAYNDINLTANDTVNNGSTTDSDATIYSENGDVIIGSYTDNLDKFNNIDAQIQAEKNISVTADSILIRSSSESTITSQIVSNRTYGYGNNDLPVGVERFASGSNNFWVTFLGPDGQGSAYDNTSPYNDQVMVMFDGNSGADTLRRVVTDEIYNYDNLLSALYAKGDISFTSPNNVIVDKSQILTDGTATANGGGAFNNVAYALTRQIEYTCLAGDCRPHYRVYDANNVNGSIFLAGIVGSGAKFGPPGAITYNAISSIIEGAAGVIINAESFSNNIETGNNSGIIGGSRLGGVSSNINDNSRTADNLLTDGFSVATSLPNGNGLFAVNPDPSARVLIEQRHQFVNEAKFISSQYLLDHLGLSSYSDAKLLGSGYYETKLLRDTITRTLGRHYINNDIGSDTQQITHLYNNAVSEAHSLNLSLGISLSKEQVANLTQDIIWLVKQEINGIQVLVPKLYLSAATLSSIDRGALIKSGGDLSIATIGNLLNQGEITSRGNISLLVGGDFLNESKTLSSRQGVNKASALSSIAKIEADKSLNISSNGDINLIASKLAAGEDITLNANKDVVLNTLSLANKVEGKSKGLYNLNETTTNVASYINAKNNLNISANNIDIVGSKLESGASLNLNATNDVNIYSSQDSSTHILKEKKSSSFSSTSHSIDAHDLTNNESSLNAGADINITSGNDTTILASNLNSGADTNLTSGNQVNILSDQDVHEYHETTKSTGLSSKLGLALTFTNLNPDTEKSHDLINVTNVGSNIKSDNNITSNSDDNTNIAASNLNAGGNININSGADVNLISGTDTYFKQDKKSSESQIWVAKHDVGTSQTTAILDKISANNVTINAAQNINADYKESGNLAESLDRLANQPEFKYLKDLQTNDNIKYNAVKDAVTNWDYKEAHLTPQAAAIIVIAVTIITSGGGTAATAAGSAGAAGGSGAAAGSAAAISASSAAAAAQAGALSALEASAAISLINNKGDIGKVLEDLSSSESIRNIATAAATAGLTKGALGAADLNTATASGKISELAVKSVAGATANTAINGGDLAKNIADNFKFAMIDELSAETATAIGKAAHSGQINTATQLAVHGVAGCAAGAIGSGNCGSGAAAQVAGELAAQTYINSLGVINSRDLTNEQRDTGVNIATMSGAVATMAAGGSAQDIYQGSNQAANAAEHNTAAVAAAPVILEGIAGVITAAGSAIATGIASGGVLAIIVTPTQTAKDDDVVPKNVVTAAPISAAASGAPLPPDDEEPENNDPKTSNQKSDTSNNVNSQNELKPGSLDKSQARNWYIQQEEAIPSKLDPNASLENQAKQAFDLRNEARTQTRILMKDQDIATKLNETDPNYTWQQIIDKYKKQGYTGDNLWNKIIESSQKSRASIDAEHGIIK